jgi:rhamnosyltransferase
MKVFALIVLYNPNPESILQNLWSIRNQVSRIIVIDNSNSPVNFENTLGLIDYYFYNNNFGGIAHAQNLGLKHAIREGAKFILLLDQDSSPAPDMVSILVRDFLKLQGNNINVSSIAPFAINSESGEPYKPRLRKHIQFEFDKNIFFCNELISSGTLIDASVFNIVGLMNDLLFIDGVDHEWCWRARCYNFKLALTKNTSLIHSLGDGDRYILGIRISISSTFRIYYQYRNFIFLCSKSYVPLYWKINNFIKYSIKYFYYPIFVSRKYFTQINLGIIDGIKLLLK